MNTAVLDGATNAVQTKCGSKRVRVPGKKNLCVIRSGQDSSATLPAERKLDLEMMHPVLIKGMTFLRNEGNSNRVLCKRSLGRYRFLNIRSAFRKDVRTRLL